jgi:Protein of unknown function (DUF2586)
MTLPSVTINKQTFNTGQAPPSGLGTMFFAAGAQTGTANQPALWSNTALALTQYGGGPLVEYGAYEIDVANAPAGLIRTTTSVAATHNLVTSVTGGSAITVNNAFTPYEHYSVHVVFTQGGTVGTPGILYTYSVDNDTHTSGVQALGTANLLTIPGTGCSYSLGAGTIGTGDSFVDYTERALASDTDLPATFTALQNCLIPWEGIYIDSLVTSATVGLVDTWLQSLEKLGQFHFAILNSRFKTEPIPTAETEPAYLTAMTTTYANAVSSFGDVSVGADGGHVASAITGFFLKRPTGVLLTTRAALIAIGEDPAYVGRGELPGVTISNPGGNPFDHDEYLFPGLDSLRLTTLRSFAPGSEQGSYIGNANTMQPSGGDFPWLQLVRVMNAACTICWAQLTKNLSRGVRKQAPSVPNGPVYIFEPDASSIEALVNDPLAIQLKGQVTDQRFSLSRQDDLSQNNAVVHGVVSIVSLFYLKNIQVQAEYSKTIQVAI